MNDASRQKSVRLKPDTVKSLHIFSEILKKSPDQIVEEALESYFDRVQKNLMEKNMMDENAQTNLSYDEFWEGVDI
ncbi:hypothetical protein [Hydrogenimonas sp.]